MTSVQYGFEPWIGGAGLAVNSFSVTTGGTAPNNPTTPATPSASASVPGSTSPSATSNPGAGACAVTYAKNEWSNGFTANVTVKNTGAAINNWTLGFAFPGDQKITNSWNAAVTQSGTSVTATNASYN
ncbi:MAG: cellulose binding domain-containing protein, partial [Micromonosporaceae bacterium]|nr:cellulose binding domain-containing protein [Micromonosporaceae bacterium]